MRLLYLTRHYTGHDARWLRVLGANGLKLAFLALNKMDTVGFQRIHSGVELLASPELRPDADTELLIAALPLLKVEWERFSPDVVLAGPLTDAGFLAAHIDPAITLMMSWAFDVMYEARRNPQAASRLDYVFNCGASLFADCDAVVDKCDLIAGHAVPRGCTLPWGLADEDRPVAVQGWRTRLGDDKALVVLAVRGFDPVHRPLMLIDAFIKAHKQMPSMRLWLAGDGELQKEAVAAIAVAGMQASVRLLGRLDQAELAGCYAEADLYLAGSICDGSSISLLQAMHAGLPCIVSDLPSNREWIGNEGGAYGNDADSFSAKLVQIAQISPSSRECIAKRNRLQVSLRADIHTNLPRLMHTLRDTAFRAKRTAHTTHC